MNLLQLGKSDIKDLTRWDRFKLWFLPMHHKLQVSKGRIVYYKIYKARVITIRIEKIDV